MHRLKPSVKINGTYYRYVVLRQKMLLPDIRSAYGREFFIFQQDSALCAKDIVALLDQETHDFITPANLNPVDHTMCSVLQG